MRKSFILLSFFCSLFTYSQITVNRIFPYDNPAYLVDNLLLGGGIIATNHTFEGDSAQIGFFNAINTNLGIDMRTHVVVICSKILFIFILILILFSHSIVFVMEIL